MSLKKLNERRAHNLPLDDLKKTGKPDMPSFKDGDHSLNDPTTAEDARRVMRFHSTLPLFGILLLCGLLGSVDGLKCVMCGQYNEGVGSITPCLNYSNKNANLYVKECTKKSEKFCVKYVSELSTVRDCATECVEKEIWETRTFCCNEDGCNGAVGVGDPRFLFVLPLIIFVMKVAVDAFQFRH